MKWIGRLLTRKRVAMLIAATLLAAVIWLVASHDSTPMPVYKGKTAKEWMYHGDKLGAMAAWEAFHEMGSNAVPFLMAELTRKNSAWEKCYCWFYEKVPENISGHLPEPANEGMRWTLAGSWLGSLPRKTAIPGLMRLLSEGQPKQKEIAADLLPRSAGEQDTDCVPTLCIYLNSTNQTISLTALDILGQIKLGPEAIPYLTNFPCSTSKIVQFQVAGVLNKIDWKIASAYLRERMPEQFSWMTQTNTPKK